MGNEAGSLEAAVEATAPGRLRAMPRGPTEEKELDPSELWTALSAIPRPSRKVPFPRKIPGTDQPIGELVMWPLSQDEQHAANAAADRFAKELLRDPQKKDEANLGYHHAYTNELAIQVLHRACRDIADPEGRPAFPSPKRMRVNLTTDEVGVLFSTYCTVQSELGPIRARMSRQETEAMIIRLAEGGSAYPLDSLSWELQRTLAVSMASRLVACWTAMSSAGLPPDVSSFAIPLLADLTEAKRRAAEEAIARGDEPEPEPELETEDVPEVDPLDEPGPTET